MLNSASNRRQLHADLDTVSREAEARHTELTLFETCAIHIMMIGARALLMIARSVAKPRPIYITTDRRPRRLARNRDAGSANPPSQG